MTNTSQKIKRLAQLGLLCALVYIFSLTQLIKFGAIEISLCTIPVALGAIVLGPSAGAILGGFFGLLSFLQCFGAVPGLPVSVFGQFLFSYNPVVTIIVCFIPRILMGFFVGLIFKQLSGIDKTHFFSYLVSNIASALINTVLFVGILMLFLWRPGEVTAPAGLGNAVIYSGTATFIEDGTVVDLDHCSAILTNGSEDIVANNFIGTSKGDELTFDANYAEIKEVEGGAQEISHPARYEVRVEKVENGFVRQMTEWQLPTGSVWVFIVAFVGLNGLVEIIVCGVLGTGISKGVHMALKKSDLNTNNSQ